MYVFHLNPSLSLAFYAKPFHLQHATIHTIHLSSPTPPLHVDTSVPPALSRSQKQYFEIDVDTHTWGNAALSGLNTFKSRMAKATLRAGIVIEAEEDGEMPEQMLAAAYLSYMDPTKAGFIPPEVAQYMLDDNDTAIGPLE
eukprot:5970818-Pleurochrysis_carterae.AAC.1